MEGGAWLHSTDYSPWGHIESDRTERLHFKLWWASLVAQRVKHLPAMQETWVQSLGQEDFLEKNWQFTPLLLHGKFHGQRSLVGYSPWGLKEPDTTEQLHFT